MTPDPDIIEKAVAIVLKGGARMLPFNAGDAPVEFGCRLHQQGGWISIKAFCIAAEAGSERRGSASPR